MTTTATSGTEISCSLKARGWSQAALARKLGVSAGMVNNVVHNRVTSHTVAAHIAMLLQAPIESLWPGRYEYRPRAQSKNDRREEAAQ